MTDRLPRAAVAWVLVALALAFPRSLRGAGNDVSGDLTVSPTQFELAGTNEGRQPVVSTVQGDHRTHDLTRTARYTVAPPGVVRVSPTGYVRPAGKGEATITVEAAGQRQTVSVHVRDFDEAAPLHFAN